MRVGQNSSFRVNCGEYHFASATLLLVRENPLPKSSPVGQHTADARFVLFLKEYCEVDTQTECVTLVEGAAGHLQGAGVPVIPRC